MNEFITLTFDVNQFQYLLLAIEELPHKIAKSILLNIENQIKEKETKNKEE